MKISNCFAGVLKPSSSPELERHSGNLGSQSNSDTNINASSTPSLASLIGNNTPTPRGNFKKLIDLQFFFIIFYTFVRLYVFFFFYVLVSMDEYVLLSM